MCKNHSHLIANFTGEDTEGPAPVLTYQLGDVNLLIEPKNQGGTKLILRTSGVLYVPSWVMAGSFLFQQPLMGGPRMSLFLLPDDGTTITPYMQTAIKNFFEQCGSPLSEAEFSLIHGSGPADDQETQHLP